VSLDRRTIGSGSPGPLTRRFIEGFKQLTHTSGTPFL